ncbi:HEAT repeat domain-containing protein [Synechococcus sp. A15-28]|uniref:HEAT repeat domain-containing protein n=1 Tax=Synechococcus sp. A15-28 TaxID=1050638 RepID=UPI00257031AB|nr:HEAT repeat domain-containing protein [Synechococcus sp. A15-28]
MDQAGAIEILATDFQDLESDSDYYMAVSHLVNFPGQFANEALLNFLGRVSTESAVLLAQRKAVEVLARLGVTQAQAKIASFLDSSDIYMVENAAWALAQIGCQDQAVHQRLIRLLHDSTQNQRVLIQSLSKLSVFAALPTITSLMDHEKSSVRGAAIAATIHLSGDRTRLADLADHLYVANQMDRQSAVQDVIDAGGIELMSSLLQAPISPAFRMRAVRALVDRSSGEQLKNSALSAVDQVLRDDPRLITVLHHYGDPLPTQLLVEGLFHPDFSRGYLSMQTLLDRDPDEVWTHVWSSWHKKAHNDYGAHYFMMHLFGLIRNWSHEALASIHDILSDAIRDRRPQFRKSPSAALLSFAILFPGQCDHFLKDGLTTVMQPFWDFRYTSLLLLQSPELSQIRSQNLDVVSNLSQSDPDYFVRWKAQSILQYT